MSNVMDPLDRLRAVNPVPAREITLTAPDPVLFRRITSGLDGPAARVVAGRRRTRSRRLLPVLLVASLLGGATAYALLRDKVTKPERVECFETADLGANGSVTGIDERGPAAACADLWRRGEFGTPGQVPDLVECVLTSGVAGVFPRAPGQDVCAVLGLPAVTPVPTTVGSGPAPGPPATAAGPPVDVNARILAFRDAVVPQFLGAPCIEPAAAAALVRRELDRAGLGDWTIRLGEFTAERPCATLSVRSDLQAAELVPSPRR